MLLFFHANGSFTGNKPNAKGRLRLRTKRQTTKFPGQGLFHQIMNYQVEYKGQNLAASSIEAASPLEAAKLYIGQDSERRYEDFDEVIVFWGLFGKQKDSFDVQNILHSQIADSSVREQKGNHVSNIESHDLQSNLLAGRRSPSLILIVALYIYMVTAGVGVGALSGWFDDWSTTKISHGVDSSGRAYTEIRYAIWESLSGIEKFFVVAVIATLLIGLPMLSQFLVSKGWRIPIAGFVGALVAVGVLFGVFGISYSLYMAMSAPADAYLILAKVATVGAVAGVPPLLFAVHGSGDTTKPENPVEDRQQ